MNAPVRTGIGYDIHPLASGRALILGGVKIESKRGLLGHSDADVVTHAVADALLGAAALGDLGSLFRDDDPSYEGVSSLTLLREVAKRVRARYRIGNVDVTVVAQTPRLAPHLPGMRAQLAATLDLEDTAVSVKAASPEGLGALGNEKGIAALAIATVVIR